ncbi:hypothetical protein WJX73_010207 [Symbiochloris irregularis]|uniref:DEK-C domain-containing protein n=1 Tax=Symbiochloris irregularis TaxID=706552 RepID=A0AAW1NTJ9_9CHLO
MVSKQDVQRELAKLLKTVNFDTTSEKQIRNRLCEQLGEDVLQYKEVIKQDIESYLDEAAISNRKADTPSPVKRKADTSSQQESKPAKAAKTEAKSEDASDASAEGAFPEDGIDLGNSKRVDVSDFRGNIFVSVREWYKKKDEDKLMPGQKGISLHAADQFSKIVDKAEDITKALADEDETYELQLSAKRKVTISKYTGKPTVNIREYYEKEGEQLPGKKGIMLTAQLWNKLTDHMKLITREVARQKKEA